MQSTSISSQFTAKQGMNESSMDSLILELNNDIDDIGIILNDIEMTMFDLRDSFKGTVANSVMDKFQFYQNQNEILRNNLLSYTEDLIKLKSSMLNNDDNIRQGFEIFSQEVTNEAKKI